MQLHPGTLLPQFDELPVQGVEPLVRRLVGFLGQGLALDFELGDAALHLVDLDRHAVDFYPQPGGGLVDQVHGLVGEKTVRNVAVR